MKVFHIVGTQCAGKSHTINKLMGIIKDSASFDIMEDFYKPRGVIDSNARMNWDVWEKEIANLPEVLDKFFKENEGKVIFIESFGTGMVLNTYLNEKYPPKVLCLEIPEDDVLKQRAKEKDIPEHIVMNSVKYFRKNTYRLPVRMSSEDIIAIVRLDLPEHVEGEVMS